MSEIQTHPAVVHVDDRFKQLDQAMKSENYCNGVNQAYVDAFVAVEALDAYPEISAETKKALWSVFADAQKSVFARDKRRYDLKEGYAEKRKRNNELWVIGPVSRATLKSA